MGTSLSRHVAGVCVGVRVCVCECRSKLLYGINNMFRHDGKTQLHIHRHPKLHLHKHTCALPSPCLSSEGNHTSAWLHGPGSYKIKDRHSHQYTRSIHDDTFIQSAHTSRFMSVQAKQVGIMAKIKKISYKFIVYENSLLLQVSGHAR